MAQEGPTGSSRSMISSKGPESKSGLYSQIRVSDADPNYIHADSAWILSCELDGLFHKTFFVAVVAPILFGSYIIAELEISM